MDELVALIITRSLERIAAVLLGGGTIFMAYKLFAHLPHIADTDNFRFKNYVTLHFFKIALGALFLMFGGYIIQTSLSEAPEFVEKIESLAGEAPAVTTRQYSGMMNHRTGNSHSDSYDEFLLPVITSLNELNNTLSPAVDVPQADFIYTQISRSKLAVLEACWQDDEWGSFTEFREWVLAGEAPGNAPNTAIEGIYLSTKNN